MVGRSRGQLILIGAVAIALIIIGLAVVLNSAIYAETVGDQGTVETTKESGVYDQEARDGATTIGHEINLDQTYGNETEDWERLNDHLEENVTNLETDLQRMSVDSAGAFTRVEHLEVAENGTRIVQNQSGDFTDQNGDDEWDIVQGDDTLFRDDGARIGWFDIVIDVNDTETRTLDITLTDETENVETLEVTDGPDDSVELDLTDGPTCTVEANQDDQVVLILHEGKTLPDDDCELDLIDPELDYTVTYETAGDEDDRLLGTYNIVVDAEVEGDQLLGSPSYDYYDSDEDQPTLSRAAWTVAIEYEYDIDEVTTVAEETEVEIYG